MTALTKDSDWFEYGVRIKDVSGFAIGGGIMLRAKKGAGDWQVCDDVQFRDCKAINNSDLGFHPGSGSQRPVFRNCAARGNSQGIFFCWSVSDGLVENCILSENERYGVSIGHRDTGRTTPLRIARSICRTYGPKMTDPGTCVSFSEAIMCGTIKRIGLKCVLLLACSSTVLAGAGAEGGAITTGSLFDEMVDMANLATFPKPAFRTVQFSSYDHRSRLPGGPDWFANADGFGGEPIPNFEKVLRAPDANGIGKYLIVDVNGPGAIVRLWTAAISGNVRVCIDGSQTPVYEGSADDFFRRPYDRFAQVGDIDWDRFRRTIYQRDASYAPIPFAKSLRVLWIGNIKEIYFYHLQVRLYDKGAAVASFRCSFSCKLWFVWQANYADNHTTFLW